jgi:hypothetical protein
VRTQNTVNPTNSLVVVCIPAGRLFGSVLNDGQIAVMHTLWWRLVYFSKKRST